MGDSLTEWFKLFVSHNQGSVLSPLPVIVCIDVISRERHCGLLFDLQYAHDLVLIVESICVKCKCLLQSVYANPPDWPVLNLRNRHAVTVHYAAYATRGTPKASTIYILQYSTVVNHLFTY